MTTDIVPDASVVKRIAVIGAGTMGAQIAQQAGLHGIQVALYDISRAQVERGLASNRRHLLRRVEKGTLTNEACEAALSDVVAATDLASAVTGAEIVIEAIA